MDKQKLLDWIKNEWEAENNACTLLARLEQAVNEGEFDTQEPEETRHFSSRHPDGK
jgi:hypothetical protein